MASTFGDLPEARLVVHQRDLLHGRVLDEARHLLEDQDAVGGAEPEAEPLVQLLNDLRERPQFRLAVAAALGGVPAHHPVTTVGGGQRHIVRPSELKPVVRQVHVPDVNRHRGPSGQPDEQHAPVLVKALKVPVTPGDDLRDQAMSSNYVTVEDGRGEYRSIPFRYVWPAELDLIAQLAGLRLRDRWDGWTGKRFTSESRQHVSLWEKPGVRLMCP